MTGGGWADPDPPASLAVEGRAILRAVLSDFRAWGRFSVLTTIAGRVHGAPQFADSLPADRVVSLDPEVYPTALVRLAQQCGAALIIAPESGGTLERLSALFHDAGVCLLGSLPEGVAVAADKWECHRRFVQAGLPTPKTVRTTVDGAAPAADELGYPLVVKPVDGAGCEGVGFVPRADLLAPALAHPAIRQADCLLLQRYVAGTHASVSLLVAEGGESFALSLNEQRVRVGLPFAYRGGVASITHARRVQALDLARRAVSLVPGLRGYVGVDLMLRDDGCSLIEINPRLTTSYVGLRRVVNLNLAEAVWRACCESTLPKVVVATGEAAFGEEGLGGW